MRKEILLSALLFAAGSIFAQYKIDLGKVTPPTVKYLQLGHFGPVGKEIRINNLYLEEGGIPQLPVMGEIHYNRMDSRYWRDALLKMKASGIDIVAGRCTRNLKVNYPGKVISISAVLSNCARNWT